MLFFQNIWQKIVCSRLVGCLASVVRHGKTSASRVSDDPEPHVTFWLQSPSTCTIDHAVLNEHIENEFL